VVAFPAHLYLDEQYFDITKRRIDFAVSGVAMRFIASLVGAEDFLPLRELL
jgi:hypothetical protein